MLWGHNSAIASSGSTPPATPRYTLATLVSLLALTITELITCVVVTYLLPLQPASAAPKPRSVSLYLTKLRERARRACLEGMRTQVSGGVDSGMCVCV